MNPDKEAIEKRKSEMRELMANISIAELSRRTGIATSVLSQIRTARCACAPARCEQIIAEIQKGGFTKKKWEKKIPPAPTDDVVTALKHERNYHMKRITEIDQALGVIMGVLRK